MKISPRPLPLNNASLFKHQQKQWLLPGEQEKVEEKEMQRKQRRVHIVENPQIVESLPIGTKETVTGRNNVETLVSVPSGPSQDAIDK